MNAPIPIRPFVIDSERLSDQQVKVTVTLPANRLDKLHAWLGGDAWERAEAVRRADLDEAPQSVLELYRYAQMSGTSGGCVAATLLASLYNGDRVKFDLSSLKRLDRTAYEHAMKVIRVCVEWNLEPHQFLQDGGARFEQMISAWGLEKRRRARR